jgi:hypothetical protein
MMTRRDLLTRAGLCAAGGAARRTSAETRPFAAAAGLPLGLIDCNAFVVDPRHLSQPVILRHSVLDPRLVAQLGPRRFLAVLAPASAVVLREMLRFESGTTIASLSPTVLDPAVTPLLTDDADVLYVALAND